MLDPLGRSLDACSQIERNKIKFFSWSELKHGSKAQPTVQPRVALRYLKQALPKAGLNLMILLPLLLQLLGLYLASLLWLICGLKNKLK